MTNQSVDEFLSRRKFGDMVRARVRKMNPDGIPPYRMIRGLNYKTSNGRRINLDAVGPQRFIKAYGRAAYREHRDAFVNEGHRKYVSMEYVMNAGLR